MKGLHYVVIILTVCNFYIAHAQLDSIQKLDEVVLSDVKLKRFASGYKITVISDSVIDRSPWSLTDLLRYHSNIYFKENGYGMVSSPSFRGTNASQTAVVWNGININSQLNGQIDFNTINTFNYNSVEIRSGGGSVQYGSGAIGGSIHLSNEMSFAKHTDQNLRLAYGSYDSKNATYALSTGSDTWSLNFGASYIESDNDYKYLGTNRKNENGQYDNLSFNVNGGYILNDKNVIKLYHQSFFGSRNFSGTLLAPSKSGYEDKNHRSLLEWDYFHKKYTSKLKMVHLFEEFRYFENKETDTYSLGRVNSFIGNYNLNIKLTDLIDLRTIIEVASYKGEGASFGTPSREAISATTLWRHQVTEKWIYGLNLRKDITSDFESPFVFSADTEYKFSDRYKLKLNGSRNFRVPTFNDLYWNPGGNLDLQPESSYQIDFGQQWSFRNVDLKLNGYYTNTNDMIQWVPDNTGTFSPRNIYNVRSYGGELEVLLKQSFGRHHFNLNTIYSYTVSENEATDEQLIYVPLHKGNLNVAYSYNGFECFYQHTFNGPVSIIGGDLDGYDIGTIGIAYNYPISEKITSSLQFNVNNIYNRTYQIVALRPMPNRNYQLQLTLKF